MASTPNLDIPLIDPTAPASPVVQMNAMASAIDTNVQAELDALKANIGFYVGTTSQRNAALSSLPDGVIWQDTTNKYGYQKRAGAWRLFNYQSTTSASGIFTVASGWKLRTFRYGAWFGNCSIYIDLERTGGSISVNGYGDITNTPLGVISSGFGTDILTSLAGGASGRMSSGYTDSSGKVQLAAVGGAGNILKGHRITLGGSYLLPRM